MPMMMQRWKSKPEVEFQHGGRLFSETGSSNNSAMDRDISPKFGLFVDFDIPKWVNSGETKSEVELLRRGRHLAKFLWRHNSAVCGPIWIKFDRLMQSVVTMMSRRWESKPEIEFQYGGCLFQETGSSNISTVHWGNVTEIWSADRFRLS